MKAFAALIKELDQTTKINPKIEALAAYFNSADDLDKIWTVALLSHRRPKRPLSTTLMRSWAAEETGVPTWLFDETYHIVGDLAETIALFFQKQKATHEQKLHEVIHELIALKEKTDDEKRAYLIKQWKQLDFYECFVFNKLLTGGFRIGVSQKLMTRALEKATGIPVDQLAYKLMGNWSPQNSSFQELILDPKEGEDTSKPYPFFLAYAVESPLEELGKLKDWAVEYKWDGIRAQLILRGGNLFIWSRGEELITDQFPELESLKERYPKEHLVIDGELLCYNEEGIQEFGSLQKRIGRKKVSQNTLKEYPVVLMAYDLLEYQGEDIRQKSYAERRALLESLDFEMPLLCSKRLEASSWDEVEALRSDARAQRSEGLMLKKMDAPYGVGRKKGIWYKHKVEPLQVDAVLTYAMRGHGRRSNLYTDYTFALWQENEDGERYLVTFAKAYSGLTDAEIKTLDQWIKKNTLQRFGPVREVTPHHVFEISFEGISKSSRHKSGFATRFPRISRWREDKNINEANSIDDLNALLLELNSQNNAAD